MAFVDGELADDARAEFETRLAADADLRRQVAELQELELLARAAAPREPMDHEWDALARDPLQRGSFGLGWLLLTVGTFGLGALVIWWLCTSDDSLALRLCLGAVLAGGAFLFGFTLRGRLRTLHLDPYRKVQR
jgi:anti-sigma factor RsiW